MIQSMIKKNFLPVFAMVCLVHFCIQNAQAKHIIGGEVFYTCNGLDTIGGQVFADYTLTFNMYRDCLGGGAAFDDPAVIGLFQGGSNSWQYVNTYNFKLKSTNVLDINDNPCIIEPTNLCVEKGVYEYNVTLPVINQSYLFAYQRCCRNDNIINIVNPQSTGAVFQVEISPLAQKICNNSPEFVNFPPVVVCANTSLVFDHKAEDKEGHQLVYEFCTPNASGGTKGTNENPGSPTDCDGVTPSPKKCQPPFDEVVFKTPDFTVDQPLGPTSNANLNTFTGLLAATPTQIGQHVVGICVKEYLNGELLSIVRRDFQFNVTQCEILVSANVKNDKVIKEQEFLIRSCGDKTVEFVNTSQDEKYISGYKWQFDLGNGNTFVSDQRDATVTFPDIGNYYGEMIVNPGEADCQDTAKIFIEILPDITSDWSFTYDTCRVDPVIFKDASIAEAGVILGWSWFMDVEDTIRQQNPKYSFNSAGNKRVGLEVVDINDCRDTLYKEIAYFPVPTALNFEPSTYIGCLPAKIVFDNISKPIDDSYTIEWDFGDGSKDTLAKPIHEYTEVGNYTINLKVESPTGCYADATFNNIIQVLPSPIAGFTYTPSYVTSNDNVVTFTDASTNAISWQYIIADQASFFQPNITYTFQDTGLHKVEQIVLHPSGCPDTMTQYIDVVPLESFFLPNAFTPNGDGRNDLFKGVGSLFGVKSFQFSIWNRWGELVFETKDPKEGWNGRALNVGRDVPAGVYVYKIHYINPRGKLVDKKGYATLVR